MIASTTLKLPDLYKAADDAIGELCIARGNAVFQRNQNLKDQLVVDMPIHQESQLVEDQRAERPRKLKAVGSNQAQPSCSPDVLEVLKLYSATVGSDWRPAYLDCSRQIYTA